MLLYRIAIVLLLSSNVCAMNIKIQEAKKPGNASSAERSMAKFDQKSFDTGLQASLEKWRGKMSFCTHKLVDLSTIYVRTNLGIGKQCQLDVDEFSRFVTTMCCTGFRFPNMDQKEMDAFLTKPDEKNLEVLLAVCRNYTISGDMLEYFQQCIGVTTLLGECFNTILQIHQDAGISGIEITENSCELKKTMEMVVDYYLLALVASIGIFQKMVKKHKDYAVLKDTIKTLLHHETNLYDNFGRVFFCCDRIKSLASDRSYDNFVQHGKCGQAPQGRWHQAFKVLGKAMGN